MERNNLEKFFTSKSFVIPVYQRDYAWTTDNIDDLLDDVDETIETKTGHYIGTFILSRSQTDGVYHVVDGQQRLTTLTMILNAVTGLLATEPKLISRNTFIQDVAKKRWKLEPATYNRDFFWTMLEGKAPKPETKSQRLLLSASEYIGHRIHEIYKRNKGCIDSYLESLKALEVMEFIESDEGKAIRIFQTVNDRGRPLAVIEKAKSLLIYYSNRFLGGRRDALINECFGDIFRDFAAAKEIGEAAGSRIDLIAQTKFTEDSVLRYHFLAFPSEAYDFNATTDFVLDGFLKRVLKTKQSNTTDLDSFVSLYVKDLRLFFRGFLDLVKRAATESRYFKLLRVLGVSTHLYPLLVRLQQRGLLDTKPYADSLLTLADMVEVADVRIYKTRGTQPSKDISYLACDAATDGERIIADRLGKIIRRFMPDSSFETALCADMYGNEAVRHLLNEWGEAWAVEQKQPPFSVEQLRALMATMPTVEHVFAQAPTFAFPSRGFETAEQYERENDRIGNLTLLEKEINSRCQNKTPEQKLQDAQLFKATQFEITKALVSRVAASNGDFVAKSVEERTQQFVKFAKSRWPVWGV